MQDMLRPRFATRFPAILLGLAMLAAGAGVAQQPPAAPPNPPQAESLGWLPPSMAALAQQSSWHSDFTFDRSMLALAGQVSSFDEPTRQALARLNGIAVHLYRFPQPGAYSPALLDAVRAQYAALGWKHIAATAHPGDLGYAPGQTDFWIDTQGVNVAGGAVLMAGPTNVTLIAISGDISTLDLLHLRGHFGIPRFPDGAIGH